MAGLVTDEFASTTAALISISDAEQGRCHRNRHRGERIQFDLPDGADADDLLTGANALAGQFDAGTRSGLRALAFAIKAGIAWRGAAIISAGSDQHVWRDRADLRRARRGARVGSHASRFSGSGDSRYSTKRVFQRHILTPGVSLPNVIHLFRARYARMGAMTRLQSRPRTWSSVGARGDCRFHFPARL